AGARHSQTSARASGPAHAFALEIRCVSPNALHPMATFDNVRGGRPGAAGNTTPEATKAAHDSPTPSALLDFMVQGWRPRSGERPPPVENHAAFRTRRRALSKAFPGEVLIVPTGHEKVRANDTYYRFRPSSDFYYLTGNVEPDCVLVLDPNDGGHEDVLFVEP